jgi:hypothetical protein
MCLLIALLLTWKLMMGMIRMLVLPQLLMVGQGSLTLLLGVWWVLLLALTSSLLQRHVVVMRSRSRTIWMARSVVHVLLLPLAASVMVELHRVRCVLQMSLILLLLDALLLLLCMLLLGLLLLGLLLLKLGDMMRVVMSLGSGLSGGHHAWDVWIAGSGKLL